MLHSKFHGNRSTGSGEEDLKGFYHTWAWRSFRLYDPDAANKLSFPLPIETLHKIMSSGFFNKADTKGVAQPQKTVRGLKFWIFEKRIEAKAKAPVSGTVTALFCVVVFAYAKKSGFLTTRLLNLFSFITVAIYPKSSYSKNTFNPEDM